MMVSVQVKEGFSEGLDRIQVEINGCVSSLRNEREVDVLVQRTIIVWLSKLGPGGPVSCRV